MSSRKGRNKSQQKGQEQEAVDEPVRAQVRATHGSSNACSVSFSLATLGHGLATRPVALCSCYFGWPRVATRPFGLTMPPYLATRGHTHHWACPCTFG